MRIHLISIGTRMPAWIKAGFMEYHKRLPKECALRLVEITPEKRRKNIPIAQLLEKEGERMLAAMPPNNYVLALDVGGRQVSTEELARQLHSWLQSGRDVVFLVGGADGLAEACRSKAHRVWSLSKLTFPHGVVRLLLVEQVYRAWTLLTKHPYHR